jgi:CarD family transcriptional regulator
MPHSDTDTQKNHGGNMSKAVTFNVGERVVYPSHGVGEIMNIETQTVGGMELQVYVISFPQDKMVLRVPVTRAAISGLRALSDKSDINKIYETIQDKPRQGNRMWSRRAQEYEGKINSGNIVAVAEVVRDLYKNVDNDRSYSERTIYESAINRLSSELSILEGITQEEAVLKLVEALRDKVAA